jgi:PAS domain S-box-containing protein
MDGILLADAEKKLFLIGNKSICQMLGYSHEELKLIGVMDIHPEEHVPYVLEQFEKQSRGEIALAKDIPMKKKDGRVFYADINSTLTEIAGRKYLLGVFRDITERKRVEEERDGLLSMLRHDLGNLFGSISNSLYFIEDKFKRLKDEHPEVISLDCDEKVKKHFRIISVNEKRIREFIKAFSNYSRNQTDVYTFSPVNMGEILDSTIETLSNELEEAHVTVINNIGPLLVVCDEDKIGRVWINYLTNTIKYRGKDYDNRVEIGFAEESAMYRFHVKDNGIGIAPGDIIRLNTPYTRLHTRRSDGTVIEGTGLGLASIRHIVDKHGGTTLIESEGEGKGATFYFTLSKNIRAGSKS